MQIGPVHGGVGRAVALLHGRAQRQFAQCAGRQGIAHLQALRKGGHALQRGLQTPAGQQPGDVGAELDAGTDFAEGAGLL